MPENPRIEELKKRMVRDPTSIAFAQLAEEYRRGGAYQQAVDVCREGLSRHPGYVSARVTMARALMELDQCREAKRELQGVIAVAPDNLAAIRALAEIHQKIGGAEEAFPIEMSSPAPPLPAAPPPLERAAPIEAPSVEQSALSEAPAEQTTPVEAPPVVDETVLPTPSVDVPTTSVADPALTQLEGWLDAIIADRTPPR